MELDEIANEFAELYRTLLDDEKTRGFPDPLIERTDIVKYDLKLSSRSHGNKQHVKRTMTEVWGQKWHTKLDQAIRSF